MTIINPLPFTFSNGATADATQVNANFDQIVSNVNANAQQSGGQTFQVKLTGITQNTTFTLPANALVKGAYAYCTNGTLGASAAIYIFNVTNPYGTTNSVAGIQGIQTGEAGGFVNTTNFGMLLTNSDITTTLDVSDGLGAGNQWNGATADIIIQYVIF